MEIGNICIICDSKAQYEDDIRPILRDFGVVWNSGTGLYEPNAITWTEVYPVHIISESGKMTRSSIDWVRSLGVKEYSAHEFIATFGASEIQPLPSDIRSLFD